MTFERLLETYIGSTPRGVRSFITAMQVWIKEKLFLKAELRKQFESLHRERNPNIKFNSPKFLFSEHHLSHAAELVAEGQAYSSITTHVAAKYNISRNRAREIISKAYLLLKVDIEKEDLNRP